jgi:pimeloyl-ACP methyl ester carboxylesterase
VSWVTGQLDAFIRDNRPTAHAENNGTRLFWTDSGAGPTVLLIQGFGYAHDMWYRTVPVLSPGYRVIRFDNRGAGMSDVPPGAYRISDMAEDAAAVLDAAKVDAAFVVGASLGITAPTLVIHGESDRLVPAENGRIIAERIPSARLTLIPHGGPHPCSPTSPTPPTAPWWGSSTSSVRLGADALDREPAGAMQNPADG